MDDALPVGVAEGVGDLFRDVDDMLDGQRVLLVLLQQLAQVLPVEQFHDEVEHALVLTEVVYDGDAPVLEGGGHPGLAPEALAQDTGEVLVVMGAQGFEAFHGDLTAQRLVEGAPHLAHTAAPDQFEQPVPALDQPGVRHLPFPAPVVACSRVPRLLVLPPSPARPVWLPVRAVCTRRGGYRVPAVHRVRAPALLGQWPQGRSGDRRRRQGAQMGETPTGTGTRRPRRSDVDLPAGRPRGRPPGSAQPSGVRGGPGRRAPPRPAAARATAGALDGRRRLAHHEQRLGPGLPRTGRGGGGPVDAGPLGEGQTGRQIAERPCLPEKTVPNHISRLLGKSGARAAGARRRDRDGGARAPAARTARAFTRRLGAISVPTSPSRHGRKEWAPS